jgi:hypothetical protein
MSRATLRRAAILALSALGCSSLSALAALEVLRRSLSPADGAYGKPLLTLLGDPFVRYVGLSFVLLLALPGFAVSLWALWRVRLAKAVPLVTLATVGVAAVGASANILLAAPMGLVAGIVAMQWCRGHAAWAIESLIESSAPQTAPH